MSRPFNFLLTFTRMKFLSFCIVVFSLALQSCVQPSAPIVGPGREVDPYHFTSVKTITCTHGCVVSAHPLASAIGLAVMKRGGNAFDAMIAAQLALAVVHPAAGNLGGGGFMLARNADNSLIALDYREMAPSKAGRNMYIDSAGMARTDLSQNGHLSAGVPGTVAGLFAEHKYAKLPFKELIQPAIDLAEKGFMLTGREASSINAEREDFIRYSTKPSALVKGAAWKEGDTIFQPELAKTLIRIRDNGLKGFYEGETAKLIIEEMKRGKGILTTDDLKNYVVKERTPMKLGTAVIG